MGKSILPVGRSLGANHDENGKLISFEWFRGDDIIDLSPNEAVTLNFAFSNPQDHFDLKFNRSMYFQILKEQSETHSDSDINSFIDSLLEKGVLIEVDLKSDSIDSFANEYRIIPGAQSFGNTSDHPERFGIGGTEPILFLSGWSQLIWAVSHADGSIWRGCELLAEEDAAATPAEVAKEFISILPAIVSTQCGFLEKV